MTLPIVTPDMLEAVALPPVVEAQSPGYWSRKGTFDPESFIRDHCSDLGPGAAEPYNDGRRWTFERCPQDPSHTTFAVFERADGTLGAGCLHKSCAALSWRTFRASRDQEYAARQNGGSHGPLRQTVERPDSECDKRAPWPVLEAAALYGLAGDVVRTISPQTEADPVALLLQFLAAAGSAMGDKARYMVGAAAHCARLFVVLVGLSSKGRKGTALNEVLRIVRAADPYWAENCCKSGLSSGEGLIWAVHDEVTKLTPIKKKGCVVDYENMVEHPAVKDKRLLVVEAELASPLRRMAHETNSLSPVLREAWDAGDLRVMTTGRSQSPVVATGAHISVVAHSTQDELLRVLDSTEYGNGFANRFLWVNTKRARLLPHGGALTEADIMPLADQLRERLVTAQTRERLQFDMEAYARWSAIYEELSAGEPGMLGAVTSRAEAQTVRLALIYALLDGDDWIRLVHLEAAYAVWRYCHASARYIFGESLGDPLADTVLILLRDAGTSGLTLTDVSNALGRNKKGEVIGRALRTLEEHGLVRREIEQTGGRPATRYVYASTKKTKETNEPPLESRSNEHSSFPSSNSLPPHTHASRCATCDDLQPCRCAVRRNGRAARDGGRKP